MKKMAVILLVLMLAFFLWTFFVFNYGETVHVTINGQEVSSPLLQALGGVAGLVVSMAVFLCVAILLLFIFAGIGMFLIGGFTILGFLLMAFAFPFSLPLVIPMMLIFIFIFALSRSSHKRGDGVERK
jgi:hypothetical protein